MVFLLVEKLGVFNRSGKGTAMSGTPNEGYMDDYLAEAWRGFRSHFAGHLDAALEEGQMEDLSITTAAGQTLTLTIEDDHVVIFAGDDVSSTASPDEAAFRVINIVRNSWQVVHPIFLDCALVDVPKIKDNPPISQPVVVPLLGTAESREQLQQWAVATFQAEIDVPLKVQNDDRITWTLKGKDPLIVHVRNSSRIEMWTILAREVEFEKAEATIRKLSSENFNYQFFLQQDRLIMSRTVVAEPFVPQHLTDARREFTRFANRLQHLRKDLLSARAKQDRLDVGAAKAAQEKAEAELADVKRELVEARERAESAENKAKLRSAARRRSADMLEVVSDERDQAQAELARLRELLATALETSNGVEVPAPQQPSGQGSVSSIEQATRRRRRVEQARELKEHGQGFIELCSPPPSNEGTA